METEQISEWQYSRNVAAKVYFAWIKKNGLVELLLRPETIPSIFYQKRWASENQEIIESIFLFLETMSILVGAGGTYTMKEDYMLGVNMINKLVDKDIKHPSHQFIQHGLSILDNRLEGDTGQWDLVRNNFLFEQGLTQNAFIEFGSVKKHLQTVDRKFTPTGNNRILIFANYIASSVKVLLGENEIVPEFDIITQDLIHKNRAITFCELKSETSALSNRIMSIDGLDEIVKYDLILFPNTLGFYKTVKEQLILLKSLSAGNALLYVYAPTDAKFGIGIEPLFHLHPHYNGIPNTHDFIRQAKTVGWTTSLRIGLDEEILFLTAG